jgi:hypothetical protein
MISNSVYVFTYLSIDTVASKIYGHYYVMVGASFIFYLQYGAMLGFIRQNSGATSFCEFKKKK